MGKASLTQRPDQSQVGDGCETVLVGLIGAVAGPSRGHWAPRRWTAHVYTPCRYAPRDDGDWYRLSLTNCALLPGYDARGTRISHAERNGEAGRLCCG